MTKICVFTGTRAEYGLLAPLMRAFEQDDAFQLQILVSGSHLSPEFGLTYQQIEKDGFSIDEKVEMQLSSDTSVGIVKSTGLGMIGFADALNRLKPDWLVVLGDRYEAFAVATSAFLMKIPMAHISGGDVTEGATDDALRHSISKMSYLHFTSTETYRKRVIQLGEAPERVFNVGGTGIDNIVKMELLSQDDFVKSIDFELTNPYFLVTFHPVTLASLSSESQFQELIDSLDKFADYQVIITLPNADTDGRIIIKMIQEYAQKNPNRISVHTNLGQLRYLSAIKYASAVIGNSSSGIVEVPSFKVPTVNIGDRQKGRVRAESVIDCETTEPEITKSIQKAISPEFQAFCQTVENVYGTGNATEQIIEILKKSTQKIDLKKSFYDFI